jgi:hypothetical protein
MYGEPHLWFWTDEQHMIVKGIVCRCYAEGGGDSYAKL